MLYSDECYSEIYFEKPPVSALYVAQKIGADPNRVVVFNSLSKRSNLPGLRAGFAASGAEVIAKMRQLRAYAGAPPPTALQDVAAAVWADEEHVVENRALYKEKIDAASEIFKEVPAIKMPQGGFFLWLEVENDETAALKLWQDAGVRVLPGSYLSRDTETGNPGKSYIRAAMVAPLAETKRGLLTIREILY